MEKPQLAKDQAQTCGNCLYRKARHLPLPSTQPWLVYLDWCVSHEQTVALSWVCDSWEGANATNQLG